MDPASLPFRVGQEAESKSFQKGFRGAWFRCKIHEINRKRGQTRYKLEFFDYPDDKIKWIVLYQRPQWGQSKQRKELKPQLMLRPSFPQFGHESGVSSILGTRSQDVVIVRDFWKVGDLVDWLCEGCYWSARVTRVYGEDKVQVELLQEPHGEGGSYEVPSKDLRPSLNWSPELGWTVPLPKGRGTSCCARMFRSSKRDEPQTGPAFVDKMDTLSSCRTQSSICSSISASLSSSPKGTPLLDKEEKGPRPDDCQVDVNFTSTRSNSPNLCRPLLLPLTGSSLRETTLPRQSLEGEENLGEVSGSGDGGRSASYVDQLVDSSAVMKEKPLKEDPCISRVAPKRISSCSNEKLVAAAHVDPIELSLIELEELATKIRWLKELLRFGDNLPSAMKPSWKFHEAD